MSRRDFINLLLLGIFTPVNKLVASSKKYINNNKLQTIKEDYLGNEYVNNTFVNLYHKKSDYRNIWDFLKWKISENPQKRQKDKEDYQLKVIKNPKILSSKDDYICWLGHASFLIQFDGKKILTDPCLTAPPFVDRLTDLPLNIKDIKPDYLLISHGHYDHLDSDTIKHFDNSIALIPLKMSSLIKGINPAIKLKEAGWFQLFDIDEDFKIYFLPAHHWYKRTLNDRNKILWGSFIIKTAKTTIYFAGDSGYSRHFKDIGRLFDIDIAILPIGAYAPKWFMQGSHINPVEALRAFKDLKAKKFIPMHFGTFDLSDEPLSEPEQILKNIAKNNKVHFLDIGEKLLV